MSVKEYCEDCQETIEIDEEGEVVGGCPVCSNMCQYEPYQSDDNYIPLDFEKE